LSGRPALTPGRLALCAILLFAIAGTVRAQELQGLLVLGHEVRTLQPCGDERTFWVRAPQVGQELAGAYQHLATTPYEPVFAALEGVFIDRQTTGFAADYDGTIEVHTVRLVSREKVAACRNGNF